MYDELVFGNRALRGFNVAIGAWLFASAFLWEHAPDQKTNTWVCGVLTVVFALLAMVAPPARWLNAVVAVWLALSVWVLPHADLATQTNNTVAAIAIFLFTLFLGGGERRTVPYRVPA
jgi:hypothetical protein